MYWTVQYCPSKSVPMRPASQERQQRMFAAARDLFFTRGYRVSMDAVAHYAGVSKQTVYAHFGSKEGLFRAVVDDFLGPQRASLDPDSADLAATLNEFALIHLRQAAEPRALAAGRILLAEAQRFPREAQALFTAGAEAVLQPLAECLRRAMQRSELRCDDPAAAAELLLGMLNGLDMDRQRFGLPGRSDETQISAWTHRAVAAFLRAYAPESKHRARKTP